MNAIIFTLGPDGLCNKIGKRHRPILQENVVMLPRSRPGRIAIDATPY